MLKIILPVIRLLLLLYNFEIYWWVIVASLIIITLLFLPSIYVSFCASISSFTIFDILSTSLISLSILIAALISLARSKIYIENTNPKLFSLFNIILLIVLILCFSASSIISFYIWFEASLIPTIFIIITWGYQPERIQASIYLIIYTVTASLPILVVFYIVTLDLNHSLIRASNIWHSINIFMTNNFLWLIIILGFLVKLPIFSVHLWLPKAHVEAPIAGSIVLAAILLKLGGYGLLRTVNLITTENNTTLSRFLLRLSLWGAVSTRAICLRQSDLKALIAYSSVGHIGLILARIISNSNWAIYGALIIIIAHGLCSSALFLLANLNYEITHTRSIYLTKGLLSTAPILTIWWFLFTAWNIAAPPSINLLSEIILITTIVASSSYSIIPLMLVSFLSAAYSLNIYASTQHGWLPSFSNPLKTIKIKDMLILFIHIIPIIILIIKPEIISVWS